MAIWAFYLISCVKFDKDDMLIKKIVVHRDAEDGFGDMVFQKRDLVIRSWKMGKSYMTVHLKPNGGFRRGEKIKIVTIDGMDYIKLNDDDSPKDDLGELLRCRG